MSRSSGRHVGSIRGHAWRVGVLVAVATIVLGLLAPTGVALAVTVSAPLRVSATANPASGGAVRAGDTVTYTLDAISEQAVPDGAQVIDDLSGVLEHASILSTAGELADRGLKLDSQGKTLTWKVPALSEPGTAGSTASTSFRVTVADKAPDGAELTTSAALAGDTCAKGSGCDTTLTVVNPSEATPTPSPSDTSQASTPPSAIPGTPAPTTQEAPSPAGTPKTGSSAAAATPTVTAGPSGEPRQSAARAPIVPCTGAAPAAGSPVAGFEIDGNLCRDNASNMDWDTADVQLVSDGARDATQFTQGAKESNWPWSAGQTQGSGVAPDSTDITNVYGFTQTVGDVYAYVGFERVATTGTVAFHLELNQKPNTFGPTPNRTAGDLRLTIEQQGSSLISLTGAATWTGTVWAPLGSLGGFVGRINQAPVTSVSGATLNPGQFAEVAIDLTTLFGPTCGGNYGTLNVRSSSSASDTSSLNDWIDPVALSVPDTCPSLRVNKTWVIDGTPYADGSQPPGFSAALSLTGQTNPQFGVVYTTRSNGTRYQVGDNVTVAEAVSPLPPGCANVDSGDSGAHTVVSGLNSFAITNTVTCTYLTLRKSVVGAAGTPSTTAVPILSLLSVSAV